MSELSGDVGFTARRLAMDHIQGDVDAGISEHGISLSRHTSGRSHKYWHDAADGFGGYDVTIAGNKIRVTEVCGVKGIWIFSLHELYQECQKGQLTLV